MTVAPRRKGSDHELLILGRVCDLLATLGGGARRRVLSYVNARAESLPTIAAIEGGEPEPADTPLFPDDSERRHATAEVD
jgi:hypothetical protein